MASRNYTSAVFDLDNTFYDWVAVFAATTQCLVLGLSRESGIPVDTLEEEIRASFVDAGSLEYSFLIQELPSLHALHPDDSAMDLVRRYALTVEAVKETRRHHLRLYPGVSEGLRRLRGAGVTLAALTSAPRFAALQRLRVLGLDGLFAVVAATPDAPIPAHTDIASVLKHPASHYTGKSTPLDTGGLAKPDPGLLHNVIRELGSEPEDTVMVGDDVRSDIEMARGAGVAAIWARYGIRHRPEDREVLHRFTHWSAEQLARHYDLTPAGAGYDRVPAADSFAEVVSLVLSGDRAG